MIDEREPSNMSPDEKRPKEEDAPLTQEEFEAQMKRLTERARTAGLNPIQTMAKAYIRQGRAMLDGLLDSLEQQDNSTKRD